MIHQYQVNSARIDELKKKFLVSGDGCLGCTNVMKYSIDTGDSKPIKQKHYYSSPYMQEIINKELDRMIKLEIVEPSSSPWANPISMCAKEERKDEIMLGRLNVTRYLFSIHSSDAF